MKKLLLIFSWLGLLVTPLAGQQAGYVITNYSPHDYGGFNQVWCVAQDKLGILYFGTSGVVHSFNGQNWQRIPVHPGMATRSLVMDTASNRLYVGTVGDFGYLELAPNGQRVFVSLLNLVPKTDLNFKEVNRTYLWNGKVVFQAEAGIFIYDGKTIKVIKPAASTSFALSFIVGNRLMVKERSVGLMEVSGDSLRLIPGTDAFVDQPIPQVIRWKPNVLLALSGDVGFISIDETNPARPVITTLSTAADSALINSGVLGCIWIGDSVLCVHSRTGLLFYDRNLKLKERLTTDDGLVDQSVSWLMVDRENNLWMTTMNGMSRISYGSPDRYFGKQAGFDGTFNCTVMSKGVLYVGTGSKLFRQKAGEANGKIMFEPLDMRKTEIWDLYAIGDDVLAPSSDGLLLVRDGKVSKLTSVYTNSLAYPAGKTDEFVAAERGGLRYFRREGKGEWTEKRFIPNETREYINSSELYIPRGKPEMREAWFSTRKREILIVRFSISDSGFTERVFTPDKNFICPYTLHPVTIGDSVYLSSNYLSLRYKPSLDDGKDGLCFALAPDIEKMTFGGKKLSQGYPVSPYFFNSPPGTHQINVAFDSAGYLVKRTTQCTAIVGDDVNSCFNDGQHHIWICATDALIRYDLNVKKNFNQSYTALIAGVTIGDSVYYRGSGTNKLSGTDALPYQQTRYVFSFAAPFFQHANETAFSYILDGYDTSWSAWSQKTEIQYNNLSEGEYVFRVKALNVFGTESAVAEYHFRINPPWYRTGWAWLAYVLLFTGIVYLAIRVSVYRLRRAKTRLEQIVTARTAEVVQQKVQLETAFKDIRDSITYAKRIQEAILPSAQHWADVFPQAFVLFRPRDIVSGDFYWFAQRNGKAFMACVDCTGHGVPGAFMSMIGHTMLNEIVLEKRIDAPDEILNLLHQQIRHALRQDSGGETRDGMDIALVMIDTEKGTCDYAGANRPLWICGKDGWREIKADKMPIGGQPIFGDDENRRFTAHRVQLQNGDWIYLTSDGYADQFGGDKGKKFMVKRFQQLLAEISSLSPEEQQSRLESAFISWKGNHEQVDDVLVIGIRYIQ